MPVLDLCGDLFMDPLKVWAVMSHPNDAVQREQLLEVLYFQTLVHMQQAAGNQDMHVSVDQLGRLLNTPNWREVVNCSFKNSYGGLFAGHVLAGFLLMRLGDLEGPSVRKAVWLLKKRIQWHRQQIWKEGERILPTSERTIYNYWEEFKPVAHFWAIYAIKYSVGNQIPFIADVMLDKWYDLKDKGQKELRTFLSMAESLRRFNEDFIQEWQKNPQPTLPPETMWRIADEYLADRDLIEEMEIGISNMENFNWIIDQLAKYPKRQYYDC